MTLTEFKTMLSGTGLQVAYQFFAEKACPDMPFITYDVPGSNNFSADNKIFQKVRHINIHLWTIKKDEASELLIENVLSNNGLPWSKRETYLSAERCFEIIYETEVSY